MVRISRRGWDYAVLRKLVSANGALVLLYVIADIVARCGGEGCEQVAGRIRACADAIIADPAIRIYNRDIKLED